NTDARLRAITWSAEPSSSSSFSSSTFNFRKRAGPDRRGLFVIVGWNGTILTSSDGKRWRSRDSGISARLEAVFPKKQSFVALAENGARLTSPDGLRWVSDGPRTFQSAGINQP